MEIAGVLVRPDGSWPPISIDGDAPPHERWMLRYLWHRSVQKRADHEVRIPVPVDDVNDVGEDEKKAVENLRHERALLKARPFDTAPRGGALAGVYRIES